MTVRCDAMEANFTNVAGSKLNSQNKMPRHVSKSDGCMNSIQKSYYLM